MSTMISKSARSKISSNATKSPVKDTHRNSIDHKQSPASGFSEYFTQRCNACDGNAKSLKREFSSHAWSALVAWNEILPKAVDAPVCNDCYHNFRDILIERADEVRLMASNVASAAAVKSPRKIMRA